ncbi:hypothetical protein ABK040_011761 [Willaertia magna]
MNVSNNQQQLDLLEEETNLNIINNYNDNNNNKTLQEEEEKKFYPIACANCRQRHKKCDKLYPSCTQCQKRGVNCVYKTPKKKGRQHPIVTKHVNQQLQQQQDLLQQENYNFTNNNINANNINNILQDNFISTTTTATTPTAFSSSSSSSSGGLSSFRYHPYQQTSSTTTSSRRGSPTNSYNVANNGNVITHFNNNNNSTIDVLGQQQQQVNALDHSLLGLLISDNNNNNCNINNNNTNTLLNYQQPYNNNFNFDQQQQSINNNNNNMIGLINNNMMTSNLIHNQQQQQPILNYNTYIPNSGNNMTTTDMLNALNNANNNNISNLYTPNVINNLLQNNNNQNVTIPQHLIYNNNSLVNQSFDPMLDYSLNERLNLTHHRKKAIEMYCDVVSLGFPLLPKLDKLTKDSDDNLTNLEHRGILRKHSDDTLSLLYAIHALTSQTLAMPDISFQSLQKAKFYLQNCFDSFQNWKVASCYLILSMLYAARGNLETSKFYLNFVDFYIKNQFKLNIEGLYETLHKNFQQRKEFKFDSIYKNETEDNLNFLKFRILVSVTVDSCCKDYYPVMEKYNHPIVPQNDSNYRLSSFRLPSYSCKILADYLIYVQGFISKEHLEVLLYQKPNIGNVTKFLEILDAFSKIYREHEKRRKFNSFQLPLALCLYNLTVFGIKLFIYKETYRNYLDSGMKLSLEQQVLLDKIYSEMLEIANIVTKCTKTDNFDLLQPLYMNLVAAAAETHILSLESLIMYTGINNVKAEISNKSGKAFEILEMIEQEITICNLWINRFSNDKYKYLLDHLQQLRNSVVMVVNQEPVIDPNFLQNIDTQDLYNLANYILKELDKSSNNKVNYF